MINVVNPPIKTIKTNIRGVHSNNGAHRIIKKTPAVTIVAACNNALTGVGPSIASGNQTCNPICADFAIPPINNKSVITSKPRAQKNTNVKSNFPI